MKTELQKNLEQSKKLKEKIEKLFKEHEQQQNTEKMM